MKRIFNAICLLAVALTVFASCDIVSKGKQEYKVVPYVSVYSTSTTVQEDCESLTLKVVSHNTAGKEFTVTFATVDGAARAGVDYEVVDNPYGTLTFKEGVETNYVKINIINHEGEYTGNLNFKFNLVSATDGVTLAANKSCTVTIKDLDHPLVELFGTYTVSGVFYEGGAYSYYWESAVAPVEGDPTLVTITNLVPFTADDFYGAYFDEPMTVVGKVSDDKTKITISTPQKTNIGPGGLFTGFTSDDYFYLYKSVSTGALTHLTTEETIVFTKVEDGVWSTTDGYGMASPTMGGASIDPSDLFYSDMDMISWLNPAKPTLLVKDEE